MIILADRCDPFPWKPNAVVGMGGHYMTDAHAKVPIMCNYGYHFSDGTSVKMVECLDDLQWEENNDLLCFRKCTHHTENKYLCTPIQKYI